MTAPGWPRRLVGVSVNAAIDKTAAVDRLVAGAIHRPDLLATLPGGKALNVARAAATLGLPSSVIAVLGGHAGDWIADALAQRGIPARGVRVPGETRTCLSVLDRSTGELTEFYEAGVTLDAAAWAAVETALDEELRDDPAGTLVVIAGSLPPGAPEDGVARLARRAARHGAPAAIDVGGAALREALGARPWLVKVNAAEAADAMGGATATESDVAAAAEVLSAAGASIALITRGRAGAVLVDEDQMAWRVGPPPEVGPYSVGSGDTLLAGLAVGLARGLSVPEAARYGAGAAGSNALRPGQGELDPDDVSRLAPAITLERTTRASPS